MHESAAQRDALLARVAELGSCVVALSGGVDSAVVAQAAQLALGDRALAATGISPSVSQQERDDAQRIAVTIGIRHLWLETGEFSRPEYTRNGPDRCYHCKTELYRQLADVCRERGLRSIVNGTNADDAGDYRPGLVAGEEYDVVSPLADCGLGKVAVRTLAEHWQLPVWDKPASPCLASRVAYGESVTPQRLAMIEQAEQFLRVHGLRLARVRCHANELARIEVPLEELPRMIAEPLRSQLARKLREIGFQFITLDVEGFRSGSLNALVPLELLAKR